MTAAYLLVFLVCVLLTLLLTRSVRNLANRNGWARGPELDRHIHERPVPRLGGVAIYISFMIVVTASMVVPKLLGFRFRLPEGEIFSLLGPAFIIFLLGVCDDLRSIDPLWKFVVQAFAAALLYLGGYGIHQIDFLSANHALRSAIGLPLTVGWVLLITNAFNLIDGMDGLAAGSGLFSTLVVLIMSLITPYPTVTFLTIALAGAIVGFLRFNFHPASIFLGDSGSLFIGFMLSALALAGAQKAPTMVAVAIPVVSFGLPILDVALAIMRRTLRGKSVFSGDGDHIHHKLLKRGFGQREAALILYAVTAIFGLLSLALFHGGQMVALILAIVGIGVWLGVQHLCYVEFFELQSIFQRTMQRKRILSNNVNVRCATESLNSCTDLRALCVVLEKTLRPLGFDGFQFNNSATVSLPQAELGPLYESSDGVYRYCWSATVAEPIWELRLKLTTDTGYPWGYFSLLRIQTDEMLLVDINLFQSEFRTRLCSVLQIATKEARLKGNTPRAEGAKRAVQVVSA